MNTRHRGLCFGFVSTMRGVPWGGSEELWSETASRLRQHGHRVHASVYQWPDRRQILDALGAQGVRVNYRPRRRGMLGRLVQKSLLQVRPGPLEMPDRRWLKKIAADLVVVSQGGPWDGVPWMLTCREFGIPYCAIVHANSELWWPSDDRMAEIISALSGAQRVYFVSRGNLQLMESQCGVSLANAEVVANPCRVERSSAVPWPADSGEYRMACVGRMSPSAKGQDILLEALAASKWRGRPVGLNIYGTGPSEKSIRSLASFHKLSNVYFHGYVADVRSIWADNHILALPSRFEGLPLTIVEAMLCGRPAITTAVAGNTELLHDNRTAFIAAAPTVELLDEAMERAWARRSEWRAMGLQARADALAAIPDDPVAEFAAKLLELVGAAGPAVGHVPPHDPDPPDDSAGSNIIRLPVTSTIPPRS